MIVHGDEEEGGQEEEEVTASARQAVRGRGEGVPPLPATLTTLREVMLVAKKKAAKKKK